MSSWLGRRARIGVWLVLTAAGACAAIGCNALLGFGDYEVDADAGSSSSSSSGSVGADAGSDADPGGCVDPAGFGGRGCYRCKPETLEQILNACTSATFEPFDNAARITGFDPANPLPEYVDAGPTPDPFDAGSTPTPTTDAGDDGGPPPDATPDCPTPGASAVFISGSTGFPMNVIQQAMGTKAVIYYEETNSCRGIDGIVSKKSIPAGAKVSLFNPSDGTASSCKLVEAAAIDLGSTSLFAGSCSGIVNPLPPGVIDELGPVNPVGFATPSAENSQRVISGEGAYRVYGIKPSGVAPWDDEHFIFRRTASSGNQTAVALTLGLPVDGLRGTDSSGSSNMRRAIVSSGDPEKTIGISSSDIIDISRDQLKWLAYQHYGQAVGFYPDSAPNSFDRRNVRDGHYFIWISLHVFANSGPDGLAGAPQNDQKLLRDSSLVPEVAYVMTSRVVPPVPAVNLFAALGKLGNVPQCAMKVTRRSDGAPLTPYTPPSACGCAYEAAVPNGVPSAECKRCDDNSDCGGDRPTCSFGFCE